MYQCCCCWRFNANVAAAFEAALAEATAAFVCWQSLWLRMNVVGFPLILMPDVNRIFGRKALCKCPMAWEAEPTLHEFVFVVETLLIRRAVRQFQVDRWSLVV
ncbi:unnamed protein product [Ceratitis capitata]|uniref:(Mediterranean fruit fly) hypothetical protein n=1 Tax=Ceratitis capitata TaxID=7213 RepID=A0A811U6E0_CERCA|nr:unnamed protein product [Ceratitis capitata]